MKNGLRFTLDTMIALVVSANIAVIGFGTGGFQYVGSLMTRPSVAAGKKASYAEIARFADQLRLPHCATESVTGGTGGGLFGALVGVGVMITMRADGRTAMDLGFGYASGTSDPGLCATAGRMPAPSEPPPGVPTAGGPIRAIAG